MIVKAATFLNICADRAWAVLKTKQTLVTLARGLAGFDGIPDLSGEWLEGEDIRVRVYLFDVVPAWVQEMRLIRFDERQRAILTREKGGPICVWNHRMRVKPVSATRCRYRAEIEIHAGIWTPLIWLCAQVFYRYRQVHWRRLARALLRDSPAEASGWPPARGPAADRARP